MSEVPDPFAERERALAEMLAGHSNEATAEEALGGPGGGSTATA